MARVIKPRLGVANMGIARSYNIQAPNAPQHGEGWGDFTNWVKGAANTVGNGVVQIARQVPGATKDVLHYAAPIVKIGSSVVPELGPLSSIVSTANGLVGGGRKKKQKGKGKGKKQKGKGKKTHKVVMVGRGDASTNSIYPYA